MRFVYLDEAGIANPTQEPFTVVAGVIVHADGQWLPAERRLRDLAEQHSPPSRREGFCFHAKDLFHGSGAFPRAEFPDKEFRWRILDTLCGLSHDLSLPVVFGWVDRRTMSSSLYSAHDLTVFAQSLAALSASIVIERYMREQVGGNEVATLVFENNDNCREIMTRTHNVMRQPKLPFPVEQPDGPWGGLVPFTRIVDTAYFAEKHESSILQIADACAFAIKRRLMGTADGLRFYAPIERQLIVRPNAWPEPYVRAS